MDSPLLGLIPVVLFLLFAAAMVYTAVQAKKRRSEAWSTFAARHDWAFSESWGTLEVQGLYQGQQLSLQTESRGSGKHSYTVTVVRLDLGNTVPPELSLEPEGLGDKFLKLFGKSDEEVGDAELDAAFDLKRVSPGASAVIRAPRVARSLLELSRHYQRFSIESGFFEAERRELPGTVERLEAVVAPALQLADALHAVARNPREQLRG